MFTNPYTTLTKSRALKLLQALQKTKEAPLTSRAICGNVVHFMEISYTDPVFEYLRLIWICWSDFSGANNHPVPSKFRFSDLLDSDNWGEDKTRRAIKKYNRTSDYWSDSYGKKRKELLDYLIISLKHDIADGEFLDD